MKKSIFVFALLVGYFAPFYAQDAAWYETDEWYEQVLGAKKGEANPIHLAITLTECFGHNPKNGVVFDKAIAFWLKRGGNIDQTFNLGDLIIRMEGEAYLASLPDWYKTSTVTALTCVCGAEPVVKALLKHHAKVIVPKVNTLHLWALQYQDILIDFQKSKENYTGYIDEMFQSQYASLKLLFAACDAKQQEEFLQKYPEYKTLV